jgi:hypothetical protein
MTLRGLFYRVVSAGWLPSTDAKHYAALGRIVTILRERGIVPFEWLVDNIRSTIKPGSWSGLGDFADDVRDVYRKDFWASLPTYLHFIVEKDAMAGVLAPVTLEYDVSLSVVRGYVSLSFAHQIGSLWREIEKPIRGYYLGDLDPSGLDLEQDLRAKLSRYSGRDFTWQRLAVNGEDLDAFNLFPLAPKAKDRRTAQFRAKGYTQCAELDAIPATELRDRIKRVILEHVPADDWERLRRVEELERQTWQETLGAMGGAS